MKLILTALALGFQLFSTSCSVSHRFYHPYSGQPSGNWEGSRSSWGGYSEKSTGSNAYKVKFTAYNKPGPAAAQYFTKVRAAELTLLDGREHFYLSSARLKTNHQFSHFPAYQRTGHYDTDTEHYDSYDCHGHLVHNEREIRTWHPGEFVPARDIKNYIYVVDRNLRYHGGKYTRYNAYSVLSAALNDVHGYGRPKLDPRAKAKLDSWANTIKAKR